MKFTTPKGKIVYGGGGIIPDVFVPLDTKNIVGNFYFNVMNDFVFNYVDSHRKEFEDMTISSFMEDFDLDTKISKQYFKKISKSFHFKNKHNQQIRHYLKAIFARELFGDYGFYQVLNSDDKVLQKVLELEEAIN